MSIKERLLSVMLIDDNPARGAILEQTLLDNGYQVSSHINIDNDLITETERVKPDVIIVSMEMPDRDTLENMRTISRNQAKPIIMFAERSDEDTIKRAIKAGVSAYVVDGTNTRRISAIMDVAIARFSEYQAMQKELDTVKNKLADRKAIDKAKGLMQKHHGMLEDDAYKALRRLAMNRGITLGEAAQNVIAVTETLSGPA